MRGVRYISRAFPRDSHDRFAAGAAEPTPFPGAVRWDPAAATTRRTRWVRRASPRGLSGRAHTGHRLPALRVERDVRVDGQEPARGEEAEAGRLEPVRARTRRGVVDQLARAERAVRAAAGDEHALG